MKKNARLISGRSERTTLERFLKWVYPEPNTGCWLWGGSENKKGYGNTKKMTIDGHLLRGSHRIAYYLYNGVFDYKLLVCHTCDTPSCVNPKHLFLGTVQENTEDMRKKGRASKGEHRPNSKLKAQDVIEIRNKYSTGKYTTRQLATEYSMDHGNIGGIIRKLTWKHV